MANLIAMIVGWNGPFYPLYVIALAGRSISASVMLTAVSAPFFLSIPAIARSSSRAARVALPIIGTMNTLWCIKLLGPSCGLELFLLPCIVLSALLYRRDERLLLFIASIPFAANFLPDRFFGEPFIVIPDGAIKSLTALNEGSVLALVFLIAWRFATLLCNVEIDRRSR